MLLYSIWFKGHVSGFIYVTFIVKYPNQNNILMKLIKFAKKQQQYNCIACNGQQLSIKHNIVFNAY